MSGLKLVSIRCRCHRGCGCCLVTLSLMLLFSFLEQIYMTQWMGFFVDWNIAYNSLHFISQFCTLNYWFHKIFKQSTDHLLSFLISSSYTLNKGNSVMPLTLFALFDFICQISKNNTKSTTELHQYKLVNNSLLGCKLFINCPRGNLTLYVLISPCHRLSLVMQGILISLMFVDFR